MPESNMGSEAVTQGYMQKRLELVQAAARLRLVQQLIDKDFAEQNMQLAQGNKDQLTSYYADLDTYPYGQMVIMLAADGRPEIAAAVNRHSNGSAHSSELCIQTDINGSETVIFTTYDKMDQDALAAMYDIGSGVDVPKERQCMTLDDIESGARLPSDAAGFSRAAKLAYDFVYYRAEET